jgi:hypothetical protein
MSSGAPPPQPPPYRPYRQARAATPHARAISCVRFSPCGRLLATASLDGTVALLSPSSLAAIATLRGHTHGVSDLSWSTDSFYLCSASDDRTLRIWDIRSVLSGPKPAAPPIWPRSRPTPAPEPPPPRALLLRPHPESSANPHARARAPGDCRIGSEMWEAVALTLAGAAGNNIGKVLQKKGTLKNFSFLVSGPNPQRPTEQKTEPVRPPHRSHGR